MGFCIDVFFFFSFPPFSRRSFSAAPFRSCISPRSLSPFLPYLFFVFSCFYILILWSREGERNDCRLKVSTHAHFEARNGFCSPLWNDSISLKQHSLEGGFLMQSKKATIKSVKLILIAKYDLK